MKFLILIAVILVVLWILRSTRRNAKPGKDGASREPMQQDMVRCPVCAVHLPRGDAVAGERGLLYCCAEHRHKAGG